MALIVPSIVAADWAKLGEALEIVKSAGASMVHVDVMDGHFVEEISVGLPVVASLRKATDLPLEVHLLIERPERYARDFVAAGADRVAFHAEATVQGRRLAEEIRSLGAAAGVALSPSTPLETISEYWPEVAFLNLLTAEPALREGEFKPSSFAKLRAAFQMRADRRMNVTLQVEGGIGPENVEELVHAGADILVAGSAIFSNVDPRARLGEMVRNAARIHWTSTA